MKRAGYDVQIETIVTDIHGKRVSLDAPRLKALSNVHRMLSGIGTLTFAENSIERKGLD
jgi:hypothetical protein